MSRKSCPPVGLVAVVILGLLTSCTKKSGETISAGGPVKQVINIGNSAEPKDLDPAHVEGVYENTIMINLFEALAIHDPKTGKVIPGAAESWTVSPDTKEYTFTIRKAAKWSNGDPLKAEDFVYAWKRILDPKTACQYAGMLYPLKNGEAYNKGKIKDASTVGVRAIDDQTLKVTLENPTSYFLIALDHYTYFPIHKGTVDKFGTRWTRPENMVSNGAFKLSKWEPNKVLTVVKNPTYWDAANVKLEEGSFYPLDNLDTEEKMFRTGQLQITKEVPPEKIDSWKKDTSGVFRSEDYLGNYFFRFNTKHKPLNDKRVRRALSLSIDREKLVKFVAKGNQKPALAMVPPDTAGYNPNPSLPKDLSRLAEAKKLLAEAGFPEGKGFPPLEILYNTQEIHKKMCEALQQMWKANLGIELKIINQEWKVYLSSMQTLNYDIARGGWIGDYLDPYTFLTLWLGGDGNNMTGFDDKKYDALLAKSQTETEQAKRYATLHEAEDLLMEEQPILPVYIWRRNYLVKTSVVGWDPDLRDYHPLKFVSIK